jgi:hypothetical protein
MQLSKTMVSSEKQLGWVGQPMGRGQRFSKKCHKILIAYAPKNNKNCSVFLVPAPEYVTTSWQCARLRFVCGDRDSSCKATSSLEGTMTPWILNLDTRLAEWSVSRSRCTIGVDRGSGIHRMEAWNGQSQSYTTTDGQSVSISWCQAQSGTFDQRYFFLSYSLVLFGAPSLTRGGVCHLSIFCHYSL